MTPKLPPACYGPLVFIACTSVVATRPPEGPNYPSAFVEAIRDYAQPHDVPAAFQHLVDWHAGTQQVVLLFTAGGRRACAISPVEATKVIVNRPYRCRWSGAR